MTPLQQMAFERLENLNKECQTYIPDDGKVYYDKEFNQKIYHMPLEEVQKLKTLLYEQQTWIEALWEEERKNGCEETI